MQIYRMMTAAIGLSYYDC